MSEINREMAICFDDVLLVPQFSDIMSRSEVDISPSVSLTNRLTPLESPIIAAPMDTVTNAAVAIALYRSGGFAVLHRYNSIEQQVTELKKFNDECGQYASIACAVGATGDYLERAQELYEEGCRVFCVDVAHGHHILVKNALSALNNSLSNIHIMTGNVSTLEAFNDLADWGAASIRAGVGGGSCCTTRIRTGHGIPTLQTIIDCSKSDRDALLIADGGIRNSGDIVKALAFGADLIMLGSMLSGHNESPGESIMVNVTWHKMFRGMASREAQVDWRGKASVVEGVSTTVPVKGKINNTLDEISQGIQSGMSYTGTRSLTKFRSRFTYRHVTGNTLAESHPHAKLR